MGGITLPACSSLTCVPPSSPRSALPSPRSSCGRQPACCGSSRRGSDEGSGGSSSDGGSRDSALTSRTASRGSDFGGNAGAGTYNPLTVDRRVPRRCRTCPRTERPIFRLGRSKRQLRRVANRSVWLVPPQAVHSPERLLLLGAVVLAPASDRPQNLALSGNVDGTDPSAPPVDPALRPIRQV